MKGNTRAATAIAVGYFLGRRKKLRTATLMAAGTAVGGAAAGSALRQGMKKAGSADALSKVTPELGEVTKALRGQLLTAGKAAAVAAVNNRVDSLAGSLHDRAERLRTPQVAGDGKPRDADSESDEDADDERYADDEYDEDEDIDEEEDVDDELDSGEEPDDYEDDELADEEDEAEEPEEEEEEEEEPPRPARRRSSGTRAPVTRARRK